MTSSNKEYNGHKNWEYWNVSHWLHNDENSYNLIVDTTKQFPLYQAAEHILDIIRLNVPNPLNPTTPDGASYNIGNVTEAIKEFYE